MSSQILRIELPVLHSSITQTPRPTKSPVARPILRRGRNDPGHTSTLAGWGALRVSLSVTQNCRGHVRCWPDQHDNDTPGIGRDLDGSSYGFLSGPRRGRGQTSARVRGWRSNCRTATCDVGRDRRARALRQV